MIVCLFFTVCNLNKNKVDEERQIICYEVDSIYDIGFFQNDRVKSLGLYIQKALANTFLREEFNLVLEKYKREVDTIIIGSDPFPIEYPIQIYLDKYKINRPDCLP